MKYNKSLDHALLATYFARKSVKAKSAKLKAAFRNKALKAILAAGAQKDAERGMRVLEASLRLAAANEGLIDEELPEADMNIEADNGFDDLDVEVEADADEDDAIEADADADEDDYVDVDVEVDDDEDDAIEADADEEDDAVEVDADEETLSDDEVNEAVARVMARAAARKRLAARAVARKRLAARARIRR